MSASPWLSASSASRAPSAGSSHDIDPWADVDAGHLYPAASSSSSQYHQLRSRKSSQASLANSSALGAQAVDRHPLRSPSPGQSAAAPVDLTRPGAPPRRPSAIASEWKAISTGLADLFGGSSSTAASSSYQWPADPAIPTPSVRTSRHFASHARNSTPHTYSDDDDDAVRKGRPANTVESALDRLEDWFGLKGQQRQQQTTSYASTSAPRRPSAAATSSALTSEGVEQVRVLIHPVAPTDTLSSLALHYGADIQVLRKSNKLWPGDPVQIRKFIYIPVDSCKHRPPNAEIKVLSSRGGSEWSESASTLAFVPKADDEDLLTGTPIAEMSQPDLVAESLASMRVSDPASAFMPDTNKAYTDSSPALSASLTRTGSINGVKHPYPASLAPALQNLNQTASSSSTKRPLSSIGGGSDTPSVAASASAASSGFVPPRQPLHVAKVPADSLRFFANDAKSSAAASGSRKPGPGDAEFRPGESGIDDLLALAASSHQPSSSASSTARPNSVRETALSIHSGMDEEDDEWKPNTWHFGRTRDRPSSQRHGANHSELDLDRPETGSSNQYAGWNDAPPPHAIVAKAYDGGKAHQRRQALKSHRLLYDLAAGLPANTGAASKWARPIQFGDSLPDGPPGAATPGTGGGGMPGRKSSSKGGFGKLLDDTIRGRISVEAALEGAFDGVRSKTAPLSQTAQPRSSDLAVPPMPARTEAHKLPPPPRRTTAAAGPATTNDPLSSANMLRSNSSGLEQRRNRIDWTKGKDD